ncbi:hypothetical protein DSBG_0558 [Desulfosporosinus sp. BG]|nr:hypothetical protein DSBG_0558 [Desulfosporosinus sp. BG]
MKGNPIQFNFLLILYQLIPLIFFLVVIALIVSFIGSVKSFMKKKIALDEQRIEQTNRFLELYKSNHDKG